MDVVLAELLRQPSPTMLIMPCVLRSSGHGWYYSYWISFHAALPHLPFANTCCFDKAAAVEHKQHEFNPHYDQVPRIEADATPCSALHQGTVGTECSSSVRVPLCVYIPLDMWPTCSAVDLPSWNKTFAEQRKLRLRIPVRRTPVHITGRAPLGRCHQLHQLHDAENSCWVNTKQTKHRRPSSPIKRSLKAVGSCSARAKVVSSAFTPELNSRSDLCCHN